MKELRREAKLLKPMVHIGKEGVTKGIIEQIDMELKNKRLIKIKLRTSSFDTREEKQQMIDSIIEPTRAKVVEQVGHTLTIHR
jgi:RNA-binding protein